MKIISYNIKDAGLGKKKSYSRNFSDIIPDIVVLKEIKDELMHW